MIISNGSSGHVIRICGTWPPLWHNSTHADRIHSVFKGWQVIDSTDLLGVAAYRSVCLRGQFAMRPSSRLDPNCSVDPQYPRSLDALGAGLTVTSCWWCCAPVPTFVVRRLFHVVLCGPQHTKTYDTHNRIRKNSRQSVRE